MGDSIDRRTEDIAEYTLPSRLPKQAKDFREYKKVEYDHYRHAAAHYLFKFVYGLPNPDTWDELGIIDEILTTLHWGIDANHRTSLKKLLSRSFVEVNSIFTLEANDVKKGRKPLIMLESPSGNIALEALTKGVPW